MARTKQTARRSHHTDLKQTNEADGASSTPPSPAPPPAPPPPPLLPTVESHPSSEQVSQTNLSTSEETISVQALLSMRSKLKRTQPKTRHQLDRTDLEDGDCLDVISILKHLQKESWNEVVEIDFSCVDQITDIFFLMLKLNEKDMALNSVEVLNLSGCRNITDEGIRWLSETENGFISSYPENVFVLAALSSDNPPMVMWNKINTILQGWMQYVSDSMVYKGGIDSKVLTESTFADQMQMVFSQTLYDSLNNLMSQPGLVSAVSFAKDPEHSYLSYSLEQLEKLFPWHLSKFMEDSIEGLDNLTKTFPGTSPIICPLSEVNKDVRYTFSRYDEVESAMQILHDRGLCVFFRDIAEKPAIRDIEILPMVANLVGKAPHQAYIQGLGANVPCWRKEDFSSLNDTIRGFENLLFRVLKKKGLLFQFACSLWDSQFTDTILYVLTSDLPNSPFLPLEQVWPEELETGEEQRDCYMTLPSLPSSLLPCFLRKLQEMSKVLLMWRAGLVVRQGPVIVLVKLITNQACQGLPSLAISARVMHTNMRNTLTLTFNNIKTILEAMLQKRKIFAVKSVSCETCNPTHSTNLALSEKCCQMREMDIRLSEEPVSCRRSNSGIVIRKETLLPQGLSQSDYIPNHKYMQMMTQGFAKKLTVSPRCFLCNNCCVQGIYCPENLKPLVSSRLCSCKYRRSLCVYCGVCDQCLLQLTQAHVTVQPSFHHLAKKDTDSAKRVGCLVKFMAGQEYFLYDYIHPEYNRQVTIVLNKKCDLIIDLQHLSPKGPELTVKYQTSTGQITVDGTVGEDNLSYRNSSCEMYDQLDFLIVYNEMDQFKKKLQIQKNGAFIFEFDLHALGRTSVKITSKESCSIFLYTPFLIKKEKLDTKNKEIFQDGRVLKCCGSFPTVLERRMSVMNALLEEHLLHNSYGDLFFTGTAGVMLPQQLTLDEVVCPSPKLLRMTFLFHPLCVANVHNGLELGQSSNNWRHKTFLMHLVNAEGFPLVISDETMQRLIWAWQCLLIHCPLLDLPPVYDKLFPHLPSSAGVNDHKTHLIGQGVQELLVLYAMKQLSSFGESFGRDSILSITMSKTKAKDGHARPYLSPGAVQLRSLIKDNLTRFGLATTMRKKKQNYVCECHAACRSPVGTNNSLTEIPKLVFSGNPNLVTCLKLQGNRLTNIPADTFVNLPHLLKLDLSENYIDVLPESIGLCKDLLFLNVEANNLMDLPASLVHCTNIYQVHISNNRMQVLPPVLVQMKGIRRLLACNLMLTDLPENIGDMANLSFLLLKGNCLTNLPKSFTNLQQLKSLSVTGVRWIQNKAKYFLSKSHFARFLREKGIDRWMNAQSEKLTEDQLYQLFDLDGSGTLDTSEIAKFNAFLFKLFPRLGFTGELPPVYIYVLEGLALEECPLLKTPPKEIRDRGFKATLAYLKRLQTGSVDCKRTKLMLVGLGGAGKTSLMRTLISTDQESHLTGADAITDGIDICTWDVDYEGDKISYSVWDFAGQTVYYNTHQFFLSDRAVYLLLWNTRLGHEHAGLKFWLNSISVHAPKAPIFVVGTHSDQMTKMDLPVEDMQHKYHQIVGFQFVSSKTGDGIQNLKEKLFRITLQQEYMGEKIPQAWLHFESLISQGKKKIPVLDYTNVEKIAADAGIVEPSEVSQAIQFLHDLGSVQYFPSEFLRSRVVINPQWIVNVMACVVSVKQEVIKDGRLMHSDIDTIWSEYHQMANWLLKLTEEFDLTFPLEGENCNIVPCLLPEKRPNFEWPDINKDEGIYEMKMVYKFDYLPAGLFNRGQVRLHGYSEDSLIWKRGSYIEKNGQLALIQQDEDTELSVKVQGPNPNNILFFIHEVFEGLINESFHGVTYDYEIPCPDCTKHVGISVSHWWVTNGHIMPSLVSFVQVMSWKLEGNYISMFYISGILQTAPPSNVFTLEYHHIKAGSLASTESLSLLAFGVVYDTRYIFISYCSKDAPRDRSKVIHPADICADLEKAGFSCYFPEGDALTSREEMAQQLVHSSVFLALVSNNYAANEVCCDMYKYAVSTMKRPSICVALGENFDWKKSPSLGVITADVVFVNMINSKKPMYESKMRELLATLQKNDQISQVKSEPVGACFISYSWANSRLAVECGTKEIAGALGFGDPRQLKSYLEENGIKCWLDVDQVNVNDQLLNRIAQGLSEARVVIACVSDQYAQSKICCKELRFAIQLELPVVVAVVGTGTQWKRSEVGFNSMSYPVIDFQRPNPNACQDLLTLVKSNMLPESMEVIDKHRRKDIDRTNTSFKEMYELAQRKFLRQISSYALKHDMASYPRLFVVDIVDTGVQEAKKMLPSEDDFKSRRYCVYTLCECEQGWHSVCKPLLLETTFIGEDIEEYAPYLAHITLVMRHSPDFVLNLFSDVVGQQYLKYIQELTVKGGHTFETSYQLLRQKVFDMDSKLQKGQLKRCRLPSGKTSWLCEEHIDKLKVSVLSDSVTEVKQMSTNQVWVEAMMEALRLPQNLKITFKPTALQKRTFHGNAGDVAEVERYTQMTLSQQSSSTIDKEAIKQANKEIQQDQAVKQPAEKVREDQAVKQPAEKVQEHQAVKQPAEKAQEHQAVKQPAEKEDATTSQVSAKILDVSQKKEGEKPKKKRKKSHKKSKAKDSSETDLDITLQGTPNDSGVDSVEKRYRKLPTIPLSDAETQGALTTDISHSRIGGGKLAPIASTVHTATQEITEQHKDQSNSSSRNFNEPKLSSSQVNSVPNTPTPATFSLPISMAVEVKTTPSSRQDIPQQGKPASKTCVIL
ncbi:uncharacterized protein LOC132543370 [Ylistrum balloti]|uniref:uncharacterized protein LOC132543370 n=1 Tax=Ylistrum balloti TaxID=509963 RepID=UPI002905EF14|nr:uncharacterized protein LOC132543370 [Ylistrum balloti]